jgi:hydrogenase maturation protein HypF
MHGLRRVAVQHHHAHLASVLGEHGESGPVLGLVWDGTGFGSDGSSWGGELLAGDLGAARRLASFRPLRLPGGDRAVLEPWRVALAALEDAFEGEPPCDALSLFAAVPRERREAVRALLACELACPLAHGAGRLFDAVGALLFAQPDASFQGELALALEGLARGRRGPAYPFVLDRECTPWQLDWRPALRALVSDQLAGRPARELARRFHGTLVDAAAALVRAASERGEPRTLALSGGCFQNRILVEGLLRRFGDERRILLHARLPAGDGGLALGQALVADAMEAAACA